MPDSNVDLLDDVNKAAASDPLADLVGEGKKFKDAAALAAGKVEADKFIEQLKHENAELRKLAKAGEDTTATAKSIETLIERIEKATSSQNGNQPTNLSREDIEKLVKDGITTDRSELVRRGNRATVNAELVNHFGGDSAKAGGHLKERLAALGMSGEAVAAIAETNPKVFRELFIPQPKAVPKVDVTLPVGRTVPSIANGEGERGRSYYTKLRKELGTRYFDPAIQQQRMKDVNRLGEKFNTL